jgi:hypothetical protein
MIVNGAFERLRQSGIVDGPRRRIAFTGFISAARRTDQVLRIGLFSKPQAPFGKVQHGLAQMGLVAH